MTSFESNELNKRRMWLMIVSVGLAAVMFFASGCATTHRGVETAKSAKPAEIPVPALVDNYVAPESLHWGYQGEIGPQKWGELAKDYSLCRDGYNQSPIDLRWNRPASARKIDFHYQPSILKIIDNGHTIQANIEPGSWAEIDGVHFDLVQMHFHSQSEHTLSGKSFPLEAHLVHKDTKGKLAVIAVFFKQGQANGVLANIWNHIPMEKEKEVIAADVKWNPIDVIPMITTHYSYTGSLTSPPCTEGVNWNVMNTPLDISDDQLNVFRKIYADNYRPIQPPHGRHPANY